MHLIGGVGGGHDSDRHQVTGCMHGHTHYQQGNIKAGGADVSSQMARLQMQEQQQDSQFSLSDLLRKTLERGRGILKGIWGTNTVNTDGAAGDKAGSARTMAQVGDSSTAAANGAAVSHRTAEHSAAVHSAAAQGNPYFTEMSQKNAAAYMTPLQKVRAKVVAGVEKLAGKLPGKAFRFQAKNSFQAKSEQRSKEDLRKRSKYRKDELEIDCILTDESYLMDSYDRKGEYSQLTTKK